MKNRVTNIAIAWLGILCLWLVSCNHLQTKSISLVVSAPNSYKEVMTQINIIYKQQNPNVNITYNFEPSPILKQQIEQGAPVDILISASYKIMDDLQAKGFVISETRLNLTKNNLVIIVPNNYTIPISKFQDLTSDRVKKVALGTDKLAVGVYIKEALTSLRIYEQVKKKGVFTEDNIRQILQAVETEHVDAGITFTSEAKLSKKVKIVAIAPENLHSPILYPVAVMKRCQNVSEAKEFIQFLASDRTTPMFEKYGFTKIKSS